LGADFYSILHIFGFGGYTDYLCWGIFGYMGYFDRVGGVVYGDKEHAYAGGAAGYLDFMAVDDELVAGDVQGVYGVFTCVDKLVDPACSVGQAFDIYGDMLYKAAQGGTGTETEGNRVVLVVVGFGYGIKSTADVGVYGKILHVHGIAVAKLVGGFVKKLLYAVNQFVVPSGIAATVFKGYTS